MSSPAGNETTEPDDLNVGLIATVAVVGACLVIAIAASLTALVRSETASFGDEIGAFANLGDVKRLKAEQRAKLEAPPSWVDKSKGQIAVPIERAMELVTTDIGKNPYSATMTPPAPPPAPAEATSAAVPEGSKPPADEKAGPVEKNAKHKQGDGKAAAPAGSGKK